MTHAGTGDRVDDTGQYEGADDPPRSTQPLDEQERKILEFEAQWWRWAGAKEQAISDRFDLGATRYYQLLNGLLDRPEALEFDPMLVKRLRRIRSTRQRARSAARSQVD